MVNYGVVGWLLLISWREQTPGSDHFIKYSLRTFICGLEEVYSNGKTEQGQLRGGHRQRGQF